MQSITTIQIGKNGIPDNVIEMLQKQFKTHQNVKIIFLKSFSRDKNKIKASIEKILDELGKNYTYRIIGFTVFVKKWRKPMR